MYWWIYDKILRNSCFLYNAIKFYNNDIDGVDIIDHKTSAYRLSTVKFYLSIFLDLIDITHGNIHMVYMKLGDGISLLNLKIALELWLVDTVIVLDCSPRLGRARESLWMCLWVYLWNAYIGDRFSWLTSPVEWQWKSNDWFIQNVRHESRESQNSSSDKAQLMWIKMIFKWSLNDFKTSMKKPK